MKIYAFRLFGYSFLSPSAFWWKSSYFCFSVLPTLKNIWRNPGERFCGKKHFRTAAVFFSLVCCGVAGLWSDRFANCAPIIFCSACIPKQAGDFSMFMGTAWYVRLQSRKESLPRRCVVKESSESCFQDRLCGKCRTGQKTVTWSGTLEYHSSFLNKIYIYYITESIIRQWFIWNCV